MGFLLHHTGGFSEKGLEEIAVRFPGGVPKIVVVLLVLAVVGYPSWSRIPLEEKPQCGSDFVFSKRPPRDVRTSYKTADGKGHRVRAPADPDG